MVLGTMTPHRATHRSVDFPEPLSDDASPMDVAACAALSVAQRRELLEQWKGDERAQLRAQDEGMTAKPADGPQHSTSESAETLQAIVDALATLPREDEATS